MKNLIRKSVTAIFLGMQAYVVYAGVSGNMMQMLDNLHNFMLYVMPCFAWYVCYMLDKHGLRLVGADRRRSAWAAGIMNSVIALLSFIAARFWFAQSVYKSLENSSSLEILVQYLYKKAGQPYSMLLQLAIVFVLVVAFKALVLKMSKVFKKDSLLGLGGIAFLTRAIQIVVVYYSLVYVPALSLPVLSYMPIWVFGMGVVGCLVSVDFLLAKLI